MTLKRTFLYLLIASVTVSAAIGILVVTLGEFSETEMRILATTTTITVVSILGLTCGAAYESGFSKPVTLAGVIASIISAGIWIMIIWSNGNGSEYVVKTVMSTTLLSFGLSYVSLISFARLDRHFDWARLLAMLNVSALVGFLLYLIWINNNPNEDFTARLIGALSILLAALTVAIPVFHKLSSDQRTVDQIDIEIEEIENRLAQLKKEREILSNEKK